MTDAAPLPIGFAELDVLRRKVRKRPRTAGTGSILRRSLGQSLEYREHRTYVPGDDVRHIDWRASARKGLSGDYLVRAYEAEEKFSLLILLDTRSTMRLPAEAQKLTFGLWIAECFAYVAAQEDIDIAFMPLTGGAERRPRFVAGNKIAPTFRAFASELERPQRGAPPSNAITAWTAVRSLPPAAVTLLISDFYFDDFTEARRLMQLAHKGVRQLVLCELDTWPHERGLLAGQMVRLLDAEGQLARPGDLEPSDDQMREADSAIQNARRRIPNRHNASGILRQTWTAPAGPMPAEAMRSAFRSWFPEFFGQSEILGGQG